MKTRLRFDELRRDMPRATARALNRAIAGAQTVAVREIRAELGLPAKAVRGALTIRRATRARLLATLTARGRRLPLILFGAKGPEPSRGRGRGVTYRLQGQRRRIPSGFIATMPTGHRGVFVRPGPSRSRAGKPRRSPGLPITERFGPSITRVFRQPRIQRAMRARAVELFLSTMQHEIHRALRGR